MSKKIRVKKAKIGHGNFASTTIKDGAIIFEIKGKKVFWKKLLEHDERTISNSFRYSKEFYIIPDWKNGDYQNHSCNPNAGVVKKGAKLFLKSIKEISSGNEITFDYSTILGSDDTWTMKCKCGSVKCRGIIKSFNTLPKSLQRKYIDQGIVPDYILKSK